MHGALKWASVGIGAVAVLALVVLAGVYAASEAIILKHYPARPSTLQSARDAGAVARGRHFAFVYGCADCHQHSLQGAFIPDFGVSSRNLTRLATVFSDADFDRAVRQGLQRDATSVAEYMPSDAFQYIADSDMADLIAYIRSLKPEGGDIPFPPYDPRSRIGLLKGDLHMDQFWFDLQKPAIALGPQFDRGRVLAMAACGECHTTSLTGAPPFVSPPRPPDLSLVAAYERADFIKFMRTGKAAGNRELPVMSATARARFSHFSDIELNAIYDYLAARGRKLSGASN